MRRLLLAVVVLALIGAVAFFVATIPQRIDAAALPRHKPDVKNGAYIFTAAGCASCHSAPPGAKCDDPASTDKSKLAGGRCLRTPFGTFYMPNISPDPETGIGGWTDIQFVNAVMRGVSPSGVHYYPAFPYTSYQKMRYEDALDLKAYLDTLPPVKSQVPGHEIGFPFSIRRGLGLWKLRYLEGRQFEPDPSRSESVNRGAYLAEALAHCGECHTPRDSLGGKDDKWRYAGGPAPEGTGRIPNITPHENGIGSWSEKDIAYALETGLTPSFDSFGGAMAQVQSGMAKLTAADRAAIAAYLKALPPVASPPRQREKKAAAR